MCAIWTRSFRNILKNSQTRTEKVVLFSVDGYSPKPYCCAPKCYRIEI